MTSLSGHYWTVAPAARHAVLPLRGPLAVPFRAHAEDGPDGPVALSGLLHRVPRSLSLVLIVHGLGGRATSAYCVRAARAAHDLRIASLSLWLRGADRRGEDFGHAGLTSDLHATVASAVCQGYRRIYVLGYSIGGHVALRFATETRDPRVKAVAAVCPPLDLHAASAAFDQRVAWFYRAHVLRGLKQMYAAVAARRPVPTPVADVERVRTIQAWDALTVVPRYGFSDVEDYYTQASVAPRLRELRVPALVVSSECDPMVPASVVRPALSGAVGVVAARWLARGGHVGFPAGVDLGVAGPKGLEGQVLSWLHARQREESGGWTEEDEQEARPEDSWSDPAVTGVRLLD